MCENGFKLRFRSCRSSQGKVIVGESEKHCIEWYVRDRGFALAQSVKNDVKRSLVHFYATRAPPNAPPPAHLSASRFVGNRRELLI
ncbi:hypothetical protein J6590_071681 [Homalodisca vitripennis]|nr:hypothetical protein J6590_071681 [Homalodisca vitripennis]